MQGNPNDKKKSILKKIVVSTIVLAIIVGTITGGVIYLKKNKDTLEWNLITFPWEKKGFMWPWEQGNYTEEEKREKEIKEETVIVNGLTEPVLKEPKEIDTQFGKLSIDSIKLDNKGYDIDISYMKAEKNTSIPESIVIDRIIVDDLDLLIDKTTIKINSNQIVKMSRPKFEMYNKTGFTTLKLYYQETDYWGDKKTGDKEVTFLNLTDPTTKIGKLINIDKINTVDGRIELYYWKKVEDSDNTYLYFYVKNKTGYKKLSIKKLLLNDKIYDYSGLDEEFYPNADRGFSIIIPKKDIKKIKNLEVTFFVKTNATKDYGKGIYLTNEFSIATKD